MKHVKTTREVWPHGLTQQKINDLAEFRETYKELTGKLPKRTTAYWIIGIAPRTVQRHAPELVKRWNDRDFRWQHLASR
jgi:hypothetical protein